MKKLLTYSLILYTITVFLGKGTNIAFYITFILLFSNVIFNKNIYDKVMLVIICTLIYINFNKSLQYTKVLNYGINIESMVNYSLNILLVVFSVRILGRKENYKEIYKYFEESKGYILGAVIASQIYYLFLFITGLGFKTLWGLKNYSGPYEDVHPFGYALIIMVISIAWIEKVYDKNLIILYVLPIVLSFYSGARTPMVMLLCTLIIIFSNKLNLKEVIYKIDVRSIILCIGLMLALVIFWDNITMVVVNSSLVQKFIKTSSNGISMNGRNEFWDILLYNFNNKFDMYTKLLGNGIYSTKVINLKYFGMAIWGHSDFIDIMISFGLIMALTYYFNILNYFRIINRDMKKKISTIGLMSIFIIISLLNGAINYKAFFPIFIFINIYIQSFEGNESIELIEVK